MSLHKKIILGLGLIELLVVITLIGILSGISVPIYKSYITSGKTKEAINVLKNYQLYTLKLYAKKGKLPTSTEILFPNGDITGKIDDNNKSMNLNYVDQVYAFNGNTYILLGARVKTGSNITADNNFIYYSGTIDQNTGGVNWLCGKSATKSNEILDEFLPHNCKNNLP